MPGRVLIVDDEPLILENLTVYLEDEGASVHAVGSGEEALAVIKTGEDFAVCVVDLRLPGMDGSETIRAIHRTCPNTKFIIHTGSPGFRPPEDLEGLGVVKIFQKPLEDMQPLADLVNALTDI